MAHTGVAGVVAHIPSKCTYKINNNKHANTNSLKKTVMARKGGIMLRYEELENMLRKHIPEIDEALTQDGDNIYEFKEAANEKVERGFVVQRMAHSLN